MSRYDHPPRRRDRANLYDEITSKIIAELRPGRSLGPAPGHRGLGQGPLGLPRNASTGRAAIAASIF